MKTTARKIISLVLAVTMTSAAFLTLPCDCDAARMGGGRSFGSQPAMRAPAPAPAMRPTQQRQGSFGGSSAAAGGAAASGMRQGSGFGFGSGMLGGFLLGSLFGSMGNHGSQQPAVDANGNPVPQQQSSGIGLFDILLLAVAGWLIFRFIRRRREQQEQNESRGTSFQNTAFGQNEPSYGTAQGGMQRSSTDWDALRGHSTAASATSAAAAGFGGSAPNVPADFNTDEFLRGAKMAYTRMQESWDHRDLDDIAQFATEPIMKELRAQKAEDPNPSQTQILLINASLDSVSDFGSLQRAQVYFDVLMREDPAQQQPSRVIELWTFVRPATGGDWKLDGIQQVEN